MKKKCSQTAVDWPPPRSVKKLEACDNAVYIMLELQFLESTI